MSRNPRAAAAERPMVAGVGISNPGRVIYPDLGITKLDVARYYEAIGEWIVPHVRGRPLTLVHCPKGMLADCSYMRHTRIWGPSVLRRVRIRERTKIGEYLVADKLAAVVSLVQMGVLEIHTWNSTVAHLEQPDRLVWDLDPGPVVTWRQVIAAARLVREMLNVLGLESWVKTTGGRGLHVVVPIVPQRDWSECLTFTRAVAAALTRTDPQRYTTAYGKRGRESKILIDYLRNNRTNTSIAALSTRARPGAPVSMPIAWNDLEPDLRPQAFTVRTVPRRLARLRTDPWAKYWSARQRITEAALQAVSRL